jgi:hypothetical protein
MHAEIAATAHGAPTVRFSSTQPTIRATWLSAVGRHPADELLEWPADMFAFTEVVIERTELYRFVVSPPPGQTWPPASSPPWRDVVSAAARNWTEQAGDSSALLPDLVADQWQVVRDALDVSLEEIVSGREWRLCEALLTLHAVADEACRGVAVGTSERGDTAGAVPAQMRELLARNGSIARTDPARLRVVPKYRTPSGGITSRSISRYASLEQSTVKYHVHRMGTPSGVSARGQLNVLLLPWPLSVSSTDFHPVPRSVHERDVEPFGLFRYDPSEPFDLSLVDGLLDAAGEHVGRVDIVIAPESSVPHEALVDLEALLDRRGVAMVIAGLRNGTTRADGIGSNWVHFGVSREGRWSHYRQDKHHRWSLDRSQIEQYRLAQVLDPRVRWWEAIEIQPRSVQMIERDDGNSIASLVCEDLAQVDEVVHLLRAVGPTLIVALLLDGPQIASRWTARYASMLADDPGCAVLTLTPNGMAERARRSGQRPSAAVALWKDSDRGLREIRLDRSAHGILLRLESRRALRRAADGRRPEHNAVDLRLADVVQLRRCPVNRWRRDMTTWAS